MRNIIFIGGIHGVGKGTLCEELCERFNFQHLSSSEVLKWSEISDKANKRVKNFDSTQNRLINGLRKLIKKDAKYFLDGHFCLLDSKGKPQKISEETFYKIGPIAIIVLTCDIQTIIDRLENRDNQKYNPSLIEDMQNMEVEYAKEVSQKLNVPFFNIDNANNKLFLNYLKTI
ncbi:ATP-binding protein [Sinomicrobium sp. M5D2P17]